MTQQQAAIWTPLLIESISRKLREFHALNGCIYIQSKVPLHLGFLIPDFLWNVPELTREVKLSVKGPATHEEFEGQVRFLGLTLQANRREGTLCYKCEAVD